MSTLLNFLRLVETLATRSAVVVTVGCVIWGVLTRYVTAKPAVWTTELSGLAFTWTVFMGAMIAFRRGAHVSIPIFVDALPDGLKIPLRKLSAIAATVFLTYCAYLSFKMMLDGASRISPVLKIPFSLVYLAPLISFAAMTARSALSVFTLIDDEDDPVLDAGSL